MKKIFGFCKKYEIVIRLILCTLFFITLFLPYYYVPFNKSSRVSLSLNNLLLPVNSVDGYSMSLKYQMEYYKSTPYLFQIVLFSIILIGLILSLFQRKSRILESIFNIITILFVGFFFSIIYEIIRLSSLWDSKIIPHVSFYIWLLLFIIDCIYLFMALQKAFPFKKNINSDEDKNS